MWHILAKDISLERMNSDSLLPGCPSFLFLKGRFDAQSRTAISWAVLLGDGHIRLPEMKHRTLILENIVDLPYCPWTACFWTCSSYCIQHNVSCSGMQFLTCFILIQFKISSQTPNLHSEETSGNRRLLSIFLYSLYACSICTHRYVHIYFFLYSSDVLCLFFWNVLFPQNNFNFVKLWFGTLLFKTFRYLLGNIPCMSVEHEVLK